MVALLLVMVAAAEPVENLCVARPGSQTNMAISIDVSVDGTYATTLRQGRKTCLSVPAGDHELTVKYTRGDAPERTLSWTADADHTAYFLVFVAPMSVGLNQVGAEEYLTTTRLMSKVKDK